MRTILNCFGLGLLLVGFCGGCAPTASNAPEKSAATGKADTEVSWIHWQGKKAVLADPLGTNFAAIWKMPESARLESQTLDRLSWVPWRFLRGEIGTTNPASALLRPLLEDMVTEESHTELRQTTNGLSEIVFAIRLNADRATVWNNNLAGVLKSLTGMNVEANQSQGWVLKKHHAPDLIELARVGDWTVVGAGEEQNLLFDKLVARIGRQHAPATAKKNWLEANVDLGAVAGNFLAEQGWTSNLPRLVLAFTGEGATVHTRAEWKFPQALHLQLDPWQVPTNFFNHQILGFTAFRGIRPLLESQPALTRFASGPLPNQIFFWSFFGSPMEDYFAAPLPDATNQVNSIVDQLIQKMNPWLSAIGNGHMDRHGAGLSWSGIPMVVPFLRAEPSGSVSYLFTGLWPIVSSQQSELEPANELIVHQLFAQTNVLGYQWEVTGPRVMDAFQTLQLIRLGIGRAQLPVDSVANVWLRTIGPRLGNFVAVTTQPSRNELLFVSRSSVGLTALQLHMVADWLESAKFPQGLHTTTVLADPYSGLPVGN